ncbi:MAG: hypothetical protein Q9222_001941 [Ikaeria aurantiellina]
MARLLKLDRDSGIDTRAVVDLERHPLLNQPAPPSAEDLEQFYREHAANLAVGACEKALSEWGGHVADITHVVAVTATHAGSPGYDQAVALRLGIPATAERVLLSGVGCAGGLVALRVAACLCLAAEHRGRSARVLVFATELCSTQIRCELDHASRTQDPCIGPALFGDGAAALVLSNELSSQSRQHGIYALTNWTTSIIPKTDEDMAYRTTSMGFLLRLAKRVPQLAAEAVKSHFRELVCDDGIWPHPEWSPDPKQYDWALHPGGKLVIKAVQEAMGLSDHQLRATNHVYRTRGNASSVAVLAVLDHLRNTANGQDDVVACSFGPGLTVEMAKLKRLH